MKNILILTAIAFASCCHFSNQGDITFSDTIEFENNCKSNKYDGYYNFQGVAISNHFMLLDSVYVNLNEDKQLDLLIVLSPKELDCPENCYSVEMDRLVVELINHDTRFYVRNTYGNLISNIGGVLSKYNGIKVKGQNITISHCSGSRYRWEYSVKLSSDGINKLTLVEICRTCKFENDSISDIFKYSNMDLTLFNVNDTINLNCNCDNFWSQLQSPARRSVPH